MGSKYMVRVLDVSPDVYYNQNHDIKKIVKNTWGYMKKLYVY